jgi:hypothetical protein
VLVQFAPPPRFDTDRCKLTTQCMTILTNGSVSYFFLFNDGFQRLQLTLILYREHNSIGTRRNPIRALSCSMYNLSCKETNWEVLSYDDVVRDGI